MNNQCPIALILREMHIFHGHNAQNVHLTRNYYTNDKTLTMIKVTDNNKCDLLPSLRLNSYFVVVIFDYTMKYFLQDIFYNLYSSQINSEQVNNALHEINQAYYSMSLGVHKRAVASGSPPTFVGGPPNSIKRERTL